MFKEKVKPESKYYDGTKIMSLMDINNKRPEMYLITSNRSAGKTVFYSKLCFNRYVKYEEQFAVLVRQVAMLENCAKMFFGDIQQLFFPEYEMFEKITKQGYAKLYVYKPKEQEKKDAVLCGYVIALNASVKIKNNAHVFVNVKRIWFDEFQLDDETYLANEIDKFLRVQYSISRGGGQQYRYVPVYLTGNHVNLFNPYYEYLGICDKLKIDTKFLRGDGYVLEQNVNESAIKAREESGIAKAFKHHKYVATDKYLYDNLVVLEKPTGKSMYLCSVKFDDKWYGISWYWDKGGSMQYYYITDKADMTFPVKLVTEIKDVDGDCLWYRDSGSFRRMDWALRHGIFRFKNLSCKSAIFKIVLNYRL